MPPLLLSVKAVDLRRHSAAGNVARPLSVLKLLSLYDAEGKLDSRSRCGMIAVSETVCGPFRAAANHPPPALR